MYMPGGATFAFDGDWSCTLPAPALIVRFMNLWSMSRLWVTEPIRTIVAD